MTNIKTLQGTKILLTGGAGLIGSHIADLLVLEEVKEIIIFDNFSRGRRENLPQATTGTKITIVEGDVREPDQIAKVINGIHIVFHLAAIRLTQCAEEPRLALQVMADGTFNILEAAVAAGVKRVVAASSASIYGMADYFPTSEKHHPYNNTTLYGATKVFNEGLLKSFNSMYKLKYVALRPFNVYGPRMDIHGAYTEVLIRWIERINKGLAPIIFGDGEQSMDFIFVEDVARAFILAAKTKEVGEVFNVASGIETSLKKLATVLLATMESNLPIEYGPERQLTAMQRRLADTSYAKEKLGFQAEVSLEEGLKRLVSWWRSQQTTSLLKP